MSSAAPIARTALITGAAKRIGRSVAMHLASRGWNIAIHCREHDEEAEKTLSAIRETGVQATLLEADFRESQQAADLISRCEQALATPICLVNNGSVFEYDDIETLTEESWETHLSVNLKCPIWLAQNFAKHLPEGAEGNIVNIIDQRVWKLTPTYFSYTISKSALWTATQTLAQALAPRIRVNAVGPGPALMSAHQDEIKFEKQTSATLLGRGTTPEEIARAVSFLIESPAITGQMIALDGGQHLAWQTPDVVGVD